MELVLKTDLQVGQKLYYLESKAKNVYKPCPACNNERKVEFERNGFIFKADCPQCTGKQIKGDESNFIPIEEYSVSSVPIDSFECKDNETFTINGRINMKTLQNISYYNYDKGRQYYAIKEEAAKIAKDLNRQEKQKAIDFLK